MNQMSMLTALMMTSNSLAMQFQGSVLIYTLGFLVASGPVFVSTAYLGKAIIALFNGAFHSKKLIQFIAPTAFLALYLFPLDTRNEEHIGPLVMIAFAFAITYTLIGLVLISMSLNSSQQSKELT